MTFDVDAGRPPPATNPGRAAGAVKRSSAEIAYRSLASERWHWAEGFGPGQGGLGRKLPSIGRGGNLIVATEPFDLDVLALHIFTLDLAAGPEGLAFRFQLVAAPDSGAGDDRDVIASRDIAAADPSRAVLSVCVPRPGRYALEVRHVGYWSGERLLRRSSERPIVATLTLQHGMLEQTENPKAASNMPTSPRSETAVDTALPHWTSLERWVHYKCKQSRRFNTAVAAIEMRLGREELLSLPQYMALCPTGQCNATCEFCSVTTSRSGIIKRQLPLDSIAAFTEPVRHTIRMWGLEGNGEPTLYNDFNRLLEFVLSGRRPAYLITNASQFRSGLLPILLGLESINISLNAATAETHRRVMGLKNFDEIVAGIRELVRLRGPGPQQPRISVSFVVTRDNVAEAGEFLHFAEFELRVDRILLRPLSEIATELGAVDDLRALVPYRSDIDDLFEAVDDYLKATAGDRRAEIVFEKGNFANVRPDAPLGAPAIPHRPDVLLAPSRGHWKETDATVVVDWAARGVVRLFRDASGAEAQDEPSTSGYRPTLALASAPISVAFGRDMTLTMHVRGSARDLEIRLRNASGQIAASTSHSIVDGVASVVLRVPAMTADAVSVEVAHGPGPFDIELDLGRVRRPSPPIGLRPAVPAADRWEPALPGADIQWRGGTQQVRWQGASGLYVSKSYSRPCLPHTSLRYPVRVTVREGRLGIGVLSDDAARWVATFSFAAGTHEATLEIPVGENVRIQFVVYAEEANGLDAEIDWSAAMREQPMTPAERDALMRAAVHRTADVQPTRQQPSAIQDAGNSARADAVAKAPDRRADGASATWRESRRRDGKWSRLLFDRREIYCHKPWTDLHNFTVDGRMDVCCIATGASQAGYAWGNIKTQSFQDVWNGTTAREFRRTVNDPAKALPPCRRCPMARAYAGPLFDPDCTLNKTLSITDLAPFRRWAITRYALKAATLVGYLPIHFWLFRGYGREKVWQSVRRALMR